MWLLVLSLAAADPVSGAPAPAEPAKPTPALSTPPPNASSAPPITTPLLARFAGRLEAHASSTWPGWGPERILDGKLDTSWFSAEGDAAALGKKPWVELRFPEAVTVAKVRVLGNREPNWPKGFSIHYGLLELFDARGALISSMKNEEKNLQADVDFKLKAPVAGVRAVRFTSLMDDGDQTRWKDIALSELQVE